MSKTSCSHRKLEVPNAKQHCVTSQVLGVAPAGGKLKLPEGWWLVTLILALVFLETL